jgi:hypothetical protein
MRSLSAYPPSPSDRECFDISTDGPGLSAFCKLQINRSVDVISQLSFYNNPEEMMINDIDHRGKKP